MHRRGEVWIVGVLAAVLMCTGVGAASASAPTSPRAAAQVVSADDSNPDAGSAAAELAAKAAGVDDADYTEAQKQAAEKTAAAKTATKTCGLILHGPLNRFKDGCQKAMKSHFVRDQIPTLGAHTVCSVVSSVNGLLGTGCSAVVEPAMSKIKGWFWDAYNAALTAASVPYNVGKAVAFVTNPKWAWQGFINSLKDDAISMFDTSMDYVVNTVGFNPAAQWWRNAYAASAGIGMLMLAIGLILAFHGYGRGHIGPEEMHEVLVVRTPWAVVMMVFGPAVAYVLMKVSNGFSSGMIHWMGPDATKTLGEAAMFTGFTATHIPGGFVTGLFLFGALFVAALGIIGTFLVQTLSTYVLGVVAGIGWGMSVYPQWRKKALAVPFAVVGLIFARPALLFIIAVLFKMAAAVNLTPSSASEGLDQLVTAAMVVIALLMVTFAPWALLRWFPLVNGHQVRSAGPVMAGAAIGAAGSSLTTLAMNRARSEKTTTSNVSTSSTPGPNPGPGPGNPPPVPGPGTGAGGAAAASGTAAGGVAGAGAKAGAGAGAKSAAGAAGGASTGGALLAAQLAASAAQAVVEKTRAAADAATPEI